MDELIIVDENDNLLRFASKEKCHGGEGVLHRAFSVFVFNERGELLIQQRSKHKLLWPLYWSNTCCSHPRPNEYFLASAERRLVEEIGISCRLSYLYKFRYSARYKSIGSENEMCYVFIGRSDNEPFPNSAEIADYKWIDMAELSADIENNPEKYTPWFKMEFKELTSSFRHLIPSLSETLSVQREELSVQV
ncbi:isopentenyl-diphosphate Delta-isomerase [Candidatus Woesearchaeota archaeon]|nr:isopentenyl-diphosphate Delta-isomerase [Candidatus Woesearchaeota archaeon]